MVPPAPPRLNLNLNLSLSLNLNLRLSLRLRLNLRLSLPLNLRLNLPLPLPLTPNLPLITIHETPAVIAPGAVGALGAVGDNGISHDHRSASTSTKQSDPTHPPYDRLDPDPAGRSMRDLAMI